VPPEIQQHNFSAQVFQRKVLAFQGGKRKVRRISLSGSSRVLDQLLSLLSFVAVGCSSINFFQLDKAFRLRFSCSR